MARQLKHWHSILIHRAMGTKCPGSQLRLEPYRGSPVQFACSIGMWGQIWFNIQVLSSKFRSISIEMFVTGYLVIGYRGYLFIIWPWMSFGYRNIFRYSFGHFISVLFVSLNKLRTVVRGWLSPIWTYVDPFLRFGVVFWTNAQTTLTNLDVKSPCMTGPAAIPFIDIKLSSSQGLCKWIGSNK